MKGEQLEIPLLPFLVSKNEPTDSSLKCAAEQHVSLSLSQDQQQVVAVGYADGKARFGDLGLGLETYVNRIRSIVRKNLGVSAAGDPVVTFIKALHCSDLYLATACAQQSIGFADGDKPYISRKYSSLAWRTLENEYKGFIKDVTRFSSLQGFLTQDVADNMLADLFMPDKSGISRIASYDGRSSLCTWLRVVLLNRAINIRRCTAYSQTIGLEPNIPDQPTLARVDRMVLAGRYGERLAEAMMEVCKQLTSQERLLLLWRYEDGLQLGQIAVYLGVHQSNVTRRLQRIQRNLRDRMVACLSTKHCMSEPAIQECMQNVVENPHILVSILDCLQRAQEDDYSRHFVAGSVPGNKKRPRSVKVIRGAATYR